MPYTDQHAPGAFCFGARIYAGPVTIERGGRMTVLADSQGAAFSLFRPFRSYDY